MTDLTWIGTLLLVGTVLVGCGSSPTPAIIPVPAATSTPVTYADPFAYCAAVGTVDVPGANYVGPQVPESVAQGLQQALNVPDTPIEVLQNGSFWRCMGGIVNACFVGANLPCEAKANTDRELTQEAIDYCQQNPDSDFVPAIATGRETVYEWRCLDGAPEIVRQLTEPDAEGFLPDIWYEISPNAATGATTETTSPPPTALPTAMPPSPTPLPSTMTPVLPDTTPGPQVVKIFLIALEDSGRSGKKIGCDDSVIPVQVAIAPTRGVLQAALEELLSLKEAHYGQSGLYNALYQSDLKLDSVSIEQGEAIIHLSGPLMLGGVCDNPRVEAQLEETALQFPTVSQVSVFVNGRPLEEVLSLKGE